MSESEVIKVPKRLNYKTGQILDSELSRMLSHVHDEGAPIVLDFDCVDFIDSAGLGFLIMASKKTKAKRANLLLINLNESTKAIMLRAQLQKILSIQ